MRVRLFGPADGEVVGGRGEDAVDEGAGESEDEGSREHLSGNCCRN